MDYVIGFCLTLFLFCSIIIVKNKTSKSFYTKNVYKQSDMHNMLKKFFTIEIKNNKNFSQLNKRKEKKLTKFIILDNKAYWVADNTFYMAMTVDGEILSETATQIDTTKLSKTDINRLLFILDTLKGGKTNDSGSTGNQ